MISLTQMLYTLLAAGAALFVIDLVWYILEIKLKLLQRIPNDLKEETGVGYFVSRFVMQFAFLVAAPAIIYGWVYVLLPLYGLRSGIAVAIFIFFLGTIPYSIILLSRLRLPLAYVFFQMAGYLVKLIFVYGIIAWLYTL